MMRPKVRQETKDPAARRWVERILRSAHPQAIDLTNLFLHLRGAEHASAIVKEIGDFIAHSSRDRGKAVNALGNSVAASLGKADAGAFPAIFARPDFREAIGRLNDELTHDACVASFGIPRLMLLKRLFRTLVRFRPWRPTDPNDAALFEAVLKITPFAARLSGELIAGAFIEQLVRLGLLRADERQAMWVRRRFIVMHVVAVMHAALLYLADGRQAVLRVAQDFRGNLIVRARLTVRGTDAVLHDVPILQTKLPAGDSCCRDLVKRLGRTRDPIESRRGRLRFV